MKRYISKLLNVYHDETIKYFMFSMVIYGIGLGIYTGVLNNYLHDVLAINKFERGIVEFPRELPGLLLFVFMGFLYRFSESKIVRLSFLISCAGLLGIGVFGEARVMAICMIVVYSTGEHLLIPLKQSVAIHYAKPGKEGLAMGRTASSLNIGQVIGNYSVPVLFFVLGYFFSREEPLPIYRIIFFAAGGTLFGAFIFSSRLPDKNRHVERRKLFFRKRYTKYYILEGFFGARKQIFITFAPYVLVLQYNAPAELLSALYGIWTLSNIFINPFVGKLVDRFGYKKIIVIDALILVVLCFLYGYAHRVFPLPVAYGIICVVFVLDAVLFAVGLARAMYAKTLSSNQEEVTSSISTGLSINHFISIIIAVVGGYLWQKLGVEVLFALAGFFSLCSFFFSMTLPKPRKKEQEDDEFYNSSVRKSRPLS